MRLAIVKINLLRACAFVLATIVAASVIVTALPPQSADAAPVKKVTLVKPGEYGSTDLGEGRVNMTCNARVKKQVLGGDLTAKLILHPNSDDYWSSFENSDFTDDPSTETITRTQAYLFETSGNFGWRMSPEQLLHLWNDRNQRVDTIEFRKQPDGEAGANDLPGDKCGDLDLVPVGGNTWLGYHYTQKTRSGGVFLRAKFVKEGGSQNDSYGKLTYYASDGSQISENTIDFKLDGSNGDDDDPPPIDAGDVEKAAFIDAAHIRVEFKDGKTDVYQKFDWDKQDYYFLVKSSNAQRNSKNTWANAANKYKDPLGEDRGKTQCVPFIKMEGLGIEFSGHNTGDLQDRIDELGSKNGKLYDFNDQCSQTSDGTDVDIKYWGGQDPSLTWFYYSKRQNKLRPVFISGASYERIYLGEYSKAPGNYYQNGSSTCAPGRLEMDGTNTFDNIPGDVNATFIWTLWSEDCSTSYGQVKVHAVLDETKFDNVAPPPTDDSGDTSGQGDEDPTCNGGPLSWIFCAVINIISEGADTVFNNMIVPLLRTSPIDVSRDSEQYKAWSNMRNIANVLLVIFLLAAIYGMTKGGD